MSWYRSRWWRLALSPSRGGIMYDAAGRWIHVAGDLWFCTNRASGVS